jgi:hypothetical protein
LASIEERSKVAANPAPTNNKVGRPVVRVDIICKKKKTSIKKTQNKTIEAFKI